MIIATRRFASIAAVAATAHTAARAGAQAAARAAAHATSPATTLAAALCIAILSQSAALSAGKDAMALADPSTGSFPDPSLKSWRERSFTGHTKYEIVDAGAQKVLKGTADGTASVLYNKRSVNVAKTPWVNWSWQVQNTLSPIEEQTQSGDDFPGRLYVVVRTGLMPWQTTAINYVWSSSTEPGTYWQNPFTKKSVMIALRSGEEELGQWQHERRNVVNDFKTYFNLDIEKIDGYAVMVDADNSGKQATAYFGNITFSAQ